MRLARSSAQTVRATPASTGAGIRTKVSMRRSPSLRAGPRASASSSLIVPHTSATVSVPLKTTLAWTSPASPVIACLTVKEKAISSRW